jgi:hypothetical protein
MGNFRGKLPPKGCYFQHISFIEHVEQKREGEAGEIAIMA